MRNDSIALAQQFVGQDVAKVTASPAKHLDE